MSRTAVILDGEGIIRDRIEGYSTAYGATLEQDVRKWLKALQTPESKRP